MGHTKGHEWKKLVDGGRISSKFWKTHVENTLRIKQTNQIPQPVLARLDRHEQ